MSVVPAVELIGLDLTLRPLSNKLGDLASDFDAIASHEEKAPRPNRRLVGSIRRDAAQLRAVRELLHSGVLDPRTAAHWARAATRHLDRVRESLA